MLLKRTLTVFVFLAITWAVLSVSHCPIGSLLFLLIANVIAAMALREFYLLARVKGAVSLHFGILCGLVYFTLVFLSSHTPLMSRPFPADTLPAGTFVLLFLFFGWRIITGRFEDGLFDFAVITAGLVFVTWLFSFLIRINYFPPAGREGPWWVLSLILIVGGADTFAYFFGKAFGRTRFAPRISPNKTVEGLVVGTLCGIGLAVACKFLFDLKINLGQTLLMGTTLSLIDHVGDLAESLLKRDAGVKDSGVLPGVGGVLDMMDGILFAAPVMYFLMNLWLVQ